jgi:hypothetical protein
MGLRTMSTKREKPLWISIEEEIQQIDDADLQGDRREATVHKIAARLDEKDLNVSGTGGKLLQLRWALDARAAAGHPLLTDLESAFAELTLEDVVNRHVAAVKIERRLSDTWPVLKGADYIRDIENAVEDTRLNLLVAEAKNRSEEEGIAFLRENEVGDEDILEGLGIDQAKLDEVDALLAAKRAELKRVNELFAEVADQEMNERIRHLINHDAADKLIMQVAGVDQAAISAVRDSMKREIEEKARLAAEEAARKAAEAEGPSLENIPADEMLDHIEAIREIMEFSDKENEIRTMCEQSSIPKCLVDIAVSEPDKLDELEEQAEG